jgi:hypothetical protein
MSCYYQKVSQGRLLLGRLQQQVWDFDLGLESIIYIFLALQQLTNSLLVRQNMYVYQCQAIYDLHAIMSQVRSLSFTYFT